MLSHTGVTNFKNGTVFGPPCSREAYLISFVCICSIPFPSYLTICLRVKKKTSNTANDNEQSFISDTIVKYIYRMASFCCRCVYYNIIIRPYMYCPKHWPLEDTHGHRQYHVSTAYIRFIAS